jgi:hypothetical protein
MCALFATETIKQAILFKNALHTKKPPTHSYIIQAHGAQAVEEAFFTGCFAPFIVPIVSTCNAYPILSTACKPKHCKNIHRQNAPAPRH